MFDIVKLFIDGFVAIAWPLVIGSIFYYFRKDIRSISSMIRMQISSGAFLKWRDVEFKGVDILSFDSKGPSLHEREPADEELSNKRHQSYNLNKNLFLVHRVRPTGEVHSYTKLPNYSVSIYLVSHKLFGSMNDVASVEYYLGSHFGQSLGKFGTKYIVKNGTHGFAVKITAYGPALCEARIIFHDKSEVTISRYLDFEGTDYRYQETTVEVDRRKIENRIGD